MALCKLHGDQGYPLRYPIEDVDRQGPVTRVLVHTLWEAADLFVRQPSELRLDRFRGNFFTLDPSGNEVPKRQI